jgi:hypothetical protein
MIPGRLRPQLLLTVRVFALVPVDAVAVLIPVANRRLVVLRRPQLVLAVREVAPIAHLAHARALLPLVAEARFVEVRLFSDLFPIMRVRARIAPPALALKIRKPLLPSPGTASTFLSCKSTTRDRCCALELKKALTAVVSPVEVAALVAWATVVRVVEAGVRVGLRLLELHLRVHWSYWRFHSLTSLRNHLPLLHLLIGDWVEHHIRHLAHGRVPHGRLHLPLAHQALILHLVVLAALHCPLLLHVAHLPLGGRVHVVVALGVIMGACSGCDSEIVGFGFSFDILYL